MRIDLLPIQFTSSILVLRLHLIQVLTVSAAVLFSLISCTAIYGENASTDTSITEMNSPTLSTIASKPQNNTTGRQDGESQPMKLPMRGFASVFVPPGSDNSETRDLKFAESGTTVSGNVKAMTRRQTEERVDVDTSGPCRTFVMDVAVRNEFEFYSPGHAPNQPYPSQMDCVKTIVAPPGYLLRLDFRNEFHLEQSEDCRFDYLEIRDGAHGYSNLIGSFCGNKHPPPITSSDRYLWLRFASDENIQYSGFHAVYWYIPRPTNSDQHPEMDMCRIEVTGNEGFANRSDIDEDRIRFSTTYGLPLDCMWIISVEQGWKIMLQFLKFRLEKPNDCESNFIDVFSDRTDLPSRLKNFCGSIADSVISKSNILHVRFFAEARSINSTFEALFTAFRDKPRDEACDEDEYDCEDATCISLALKCNGRINCRFRWDEDECQPKLGAFAVILESEHIIIILIVFCLILSGMCFAFLFNCTRKLIRDHRIIQEHLRQSKENEVNSVGRRDRSSVVPVDASLPKITTISNHTRSGSNSSSGGSLRQESIQLSPLRKRTPGVEHECRASGGDIIPIFDGRKSKEQRSVEPLDADADVDVENLELSTLPEMRDSECQTRESLFSTQLIDLTNSDRSPTPSSATSADQRIYPLRAGSNVPPFSTFGYTRTDEMNRLRNQRFDFPRGYESGRGGRGSPSDGRTDEKRYRAEAVIEMESKKKEDAATANSNIRPFSIDSTKSAPDVIVTH